MTRKDKSVSWSAFVNPSHLRGFFIKAQRRDVSRLTGFDEETLRLFSMDPQLSSAHRVTWAEWRGTSHTPNLFSHKIHVSAEILAMFRG